MASAGAEQQWDALFREVGTSWGTRPARSAQRTAMQWQGKGHQHVLIPGIGYGRNAKPFLDRDMHVTGIEISREAIRLAAPHPHLKIRHGSALDLPFGRARYDGIYAYALLHLFGTHDRRRLISGCYHQLKSGGSMVFVVLSKRSTMYGQGRKLSTDRYRLPNGVEVFFYDEASAEAELGAFGKMHVKHYDEPVPHLPKAPPMRFLVITCTKD